MTQAENIIEELVRIHITAVSAALCVALYSSVCHEEYICDEGCFLYVVISYGDGSQLKIHRNGSVGAVLNIYKHANEQEAI